MNCPKEVKCYYNLEQRYNSLCNLFCTKDKAVACGYKDTEDARKYCGRFEMTIPEYDKECDCDLCTTLRNERKAEREKVYDELGVLYGESAKKFQEYMDAPPTEADREMSKRVYEIIERERIEAEKPIRKDEREMVLDELETYIGNLQFKYGLLSNQYLGKIKEKIEELRGEKR